jgi:dTDP-4-dehydrorhamnose 3,5-epimerase
MRFEPTSIGGVYAIEPEPIEDERGFFARAWCLREFSTHGLTATFVQENIGVSTLAGTVRGLHVQTDPHAEVKLVRCTAGAVWDVAVDLRPSSPTLHAWVGLELSAGRRNMLYVPEGCAHGYLSLVDGAELRYLTSAFYAPEAATGLRFDDPAIGIQWPVPIRVVSDQDRSWPLIGTTNDDKEPT